MLAVPLRAVPRANLFARFLTLARLPCKSHLPRIFHYFWLDREQAPFRLLSIACLLIKSNWPREQSAPTDSYLRPNAHYPRRLLFTSARSPRAHLRGLCQQPKG